MNNIPKIIHYCWFGRNAKTPKIKDCITSWSKCNGYQVIEWNEDNFDITKNKFVDEAYQAKKWAFVSDYVRLEVLYNQGGIYLDTDMEILKSLDDFLHHEMYLGFMYDCNLGTSIIAAKPGNQTIKELLMMYEVLEFNGMPNNDLFTNYFLRRGLKLNNKYQELEDVTIYPKEYFNYRSYNKSINHAVHHFEDSWKVHNVQRDRLKKILKLCVGEVIYGKLSNYQAIKKSPFYSVYLEHKKGEKQHE